MKYRKDKLSKSQAQTQLIAFLIILNVLVLPAFLIWIILGMEKSPFVIIALAGILSFWSISVIWQGIWVILISRFRINKIVQFVGFFFPAICFFVLPYLSNSNHPSPVNQQQPAVSRTGTYKANVRSNLSRWTIEIKNRNGVTLYNEETGFVPHINLCWIWDSNERLWLYNSNDGSVYFWKSKPDGKWHPVFWGHGHSKETQLEIDSPPQELYPYER